MVCIDGWMVIYEWLWLLVSVNWFSGSIGSGMGILFWGGVYL